MAMLLCATALVASSLGPALKYGRTAEDVLGSCVNGDCGAPLDLSDMVSSGMTEQAKNASLVQGVGNITSYSGFFQSDEAAGNNMFYWYFPAQNGDANAPLVIWLQGGPGGASTFGLFAEMGPFYLEKDSAGNLELKDRATSWNKKYSMLFIDNPVGAGFSYTSKNGYCKDTKECVARNLYSLLTQFYQVYPEEQKNELWITGESYGGHYVPAISYYIHKQNTQTPAPAFKIPFKGCAIGDGWIDPVNMIPAYPNMIYNMGMCDEQEKAKIQDYCDRSVAAINAGEMAEAFNIWDQFLNGDIWPYGNYFHNISGSNDYDNLMNTNAPASAEYYAAYLNQPDIRKALHVGDRTMQSGHDCEMNLVSDFMASLKDELVELLETPDYRVLVYSGQLDIIIGAALTERFLPLMEWSGQFHYNTAPKKVWRITSDDPEVAGYVREVRNFTQVIVRGAGHLVPLDQPQRGLDMIERFIEGRPYKHEPNPVPV